MVIKMNKDEVVEIMCNVVEDINRKLAENMPIGSDQLEEMLAQSRPQLVSINGALYDKLFEYGIIQR
jgi:hypothetical protein